MKPVKLTLPTARMLRALLDGPRYGFDLAVSMTMPTGTVFPMLGRMEAGGLVTSVLEQIDQHEAKRPARRYYQLTPAGRAYAVEVLTVLSQELRPPRE